MTEENREEMGVVPHVPAAAERAIIAAVDRVLTGREIVESATADAQVLADVIQQTRSYVQIGQGRHVKVEGWTTLAAMKGCVCREVEVVEEGTTGYLATVALIRMSDGAEISRASAMAGQPDDKPWCDRPTFQARSMAITRATSKVCRLAFSWVMVLAGYSPTPAEEMLEEKEITRPMSHAPKSKPAASKASSHFPTEGQKKLLRTKADVNAKRVGTSGDELLKQVLGICGHESMEQLTSNEQINEVLEMLDHAEKVRVAKPAAEPAQEEVPF